MGYVYSHAGLYATTFCRIFICQINLLDREIRNTFTKVLLQNSIVYSPHYTQNQREDSSKTSHEHSIKGCSFEKRSKVIFKAFSVEVLLAGLDLCEASALSQQNGVYCVSFSKLTLGELYNLYKRLVYCD